MATNSSELCEIYMGGLLYKLSSRVMASFGSQACSAERPRATGRDRSNCGGKTSTNDHSNAILDGLHGVRLHDLLRRLGLHHHHLAEDLPLPRLCRWLRARLDPAEAGQGEDTSLRHLLRRDVRQATDDVHAQRPH